MEVPHRLPPGVDPQDRIEEGRRRPRHRSRTPAEHRAGLEPLDPRRQIGAPGLGRGIRPGGDPQRPRELEEGDQQRGGQQRQPPPPPARAAGPRAEGQQRPPPPAPRTPRASGWPGSPPPRARRRRGPAKRHGPGLARRQHRQRQQDHQPGGEQVVVAERHRRPRGSQGQPVDQRPEGDAGHGESQRPQAPAAVLLPPPAALDHAGQHQECGQEDQRYPARPRHRRGPAARRHGDPERPGEQAPGGAQPQGVAPGGAIQSSEPSSASAAAALAGQEGPQANVPHQAPKRARSRGGRRPDIVRHCRRCVILSRPAVCYLASVQHEPSRRNPMTVDTAEQRFQNPRLPRHRGREPRRLRRRVDPDPRRAAGVAQPRHRRAARGRAHGHRRGLRAGGRGHRRGLPRVAHLAGAAPGRDRAPARRGAPPAQGGAGPAGDPRDGQGPLRGAWARCRR